MSVACAIPLQIPVHRVRVTVRCRELGTALHTTVRRMAERVGAHEDLIAAATGVTLERVAQVKGELARELAPIEREYLVWVDNARRRCLPYSALDGVVVVRGKDKGLPLPLDPPTPASLEDMGLSAAASWDSGVDGHVEIEEVIDVVADVRGGFPSGRGGLSHVLRLPDVHLLVSFDANDPDHLVTTLTQHAIESRELTAWLHGQYGPRLRGDIVDLEQVRAHPRPPRWLAEITAELELPAATATSRRWRAVEPHPARVRQALTDVADTARDRLDLCAPNLRNLPAWLRDALADVLARGVPVVLHPTRAEDASKRVATVQPLSEQPHALCVIADATHALVHTDPQACLDRGENRRPRTQHVRATADSSAVRELLELLALSPPPRRRSSEKLGARAIRRMLAQALAALAHELPDGVSASIEPDDERSAAATLDRYEGDPRRVGSPTQGMLAVAAGIAWERIVIATAASLCEAHDKLDYVAARWSPPQEGIDLDVIVADHGKRIVWALDAKNSAPTNEQQGKMIHQLRVLASDSQFIPHGWKAMGVIVHRAKQLPSPPHQTEQRSILRSALPDLTSLLLADALPEQRACL